MKAGDRPIKRVIELLAGVKRSDTGYTALCPSHDDTRSSLSVAEGEDRRVLVKCFAGCAVEDIVAAIGIEVSDLFPAKSAKPREKPTTNDGLTVEQYAQAKGLTTSFLREIGVDQVYLNGTPAVRIPYRDTKDLVVSVRMRLSLKGQNKFRWKTGSKPCLYGLWRLREVESQYIILVEGESDCHTLWSNNFSAMGIPGAATWDDSWAQYLDGFKRIYIVIEPDEGGETVLRWLSKSKIRNRARLIMLSGAKDPSELYLSDKANFTRAWKAALKAAVPWSEREDEERKAKRKSAWAECKRLARQGDILEEFAQALRQRGVVGERRAAKILYLALVSRFLSLPISVVLTGTSASGKSFLVERTLSFFPNRAYYALTAMSEHALAYSEEPLSNRFLVLYEGAALKSEFINYIVRSLQSEGRVRYETVVKTPQGMKARLIEREGPTGLIMTTTAVAQHPENETRQLTLTLSDSQDQTKLILKSIATKHSGETTNTKPSQADEMAKWQALQEWVELANHDVVVPFAVAVTNLIPPVAVRLRRDGDAVFNLIEAHAILHQATRTLDDKGGIIATFVDYEAVRNLVSPIISQGVEQTVSKRIRQTVEVVGELCSAIPDNERKQGSEPTSTTVLEISRKLKIDRSSASRRVKEALKNGYLKNLETKKGQPFRLVPGEPLPQQRSILPTVQEVKAEWRKIRLLQIPILIG
jgi:hypothetical protein